MTIPVQENSDESKYFLIARDANGDYLEVAERIVLDNGGPSFTQTLRPNTDAASETERLMLLEMQSVLPEPIKLVSENPFLILRIDQPGGQPAARCECKCGGNQSTCGGGGGGCK